MALAGCSKIAYRVQGDDLPERVSLPKGKIDAEVRMLERAGFGPRPGQIGQLKKTGLESYVDRQIKAEEDEPLALTLQLNRIEALQIDGMELRDLPENEMLRQLQMAALLRAVYSPNQLRERMVDFWGNHFNIYARKGLTSYRLPTDHLNVIRQHALTSFPQMLKASAHSPAMLGYLDNRLNRSGVANENYARELMELHTLGVRGGYSQKDVQEVARCFTGWTIVEREFLRPDGRFTFDIDRHDRLPKTVLCHRITSGDQTDGDQVLEILARHPMTARFISEKLCRHFLGSTDSVWADRLAKIYLETNGDIGRMLRPLLLSKEMLEGPPVIKRPLDFMVSALRALNAQTDGGRALQTHLESMGQPLFQWPMPDGYPDRAASWSGSLLARWNFSFALAAGEIQGTSLDLPKLSKKLDAGDAAAEMAELVLPGRPEAIRRLRVALHKHMQNNVDDGRAAALCLSTPEFQWR